MTSKRELPLALRRAYLALHRRTEAAFAPYGVTADQFVLLARLAEGQALTQRELARRMASDPSTVGAMLALLDERGLIQRDTLSTDARVRTVAITASGKRKFKRLLTAGETIRDRMFDALLRDEAEALVGMLTRVADALDIQAVPVGGSKSSHTLEEAS